jgi:hypothetical protein
MAICRDCGYWSGSESCYEECGVKGDAPKPNEPEAEDAATEPPDALCHVWSPDGWQWCCYGAGHFDPNHCGHMDFTLWPAKPPTPPAQEDTAGASLTAEDRRLARTIIPLWVHGPLVGRLLATVEAQAREIEGLTAEVIRLLNKCNDAARQEPRYDA